MRTLGGVPLRLGGTAAAAAAAIERALPSCAFRALNSREIAARATADAPAPAGGGFPAWVAFFCRVGTLTFFFA
eukprot:COSAG02_NODE_5691_length_4121_cov_2.342118_2_plen_74_part_00